MATDLQIANLALTRIGHAMLDSAFSASGNKASRWFYVNYDIVRQALLREFPWNFAIKRAVLTLDSFYTITGITNANPAVVTAVGHGFSNGDAVYIDGVIGIGDINGKTYTVANATADTFELSGVDSTSYAAYSSAGTAYPYIAKEFAYRFAIPSDSLRVLRINGSERDTYRIENGYIYTNEGSAHIEYIYDAETEADFDGQFTDVFAARLSAEICFYLTDNSTLTEQSWQVYNDKIRLARSLDSMEGTPRSIDADIWLRARL